MRRGCVYGSLEEQSVETVFVELGELALCLGFSQPFQTLLAKVQTPPPRLTALLTSKVMVRVQELAGTESRQVELKSIGRGQLLGTGLGSSSRFPVGNSVLCIIRGRQGRGTGCTTTTSNSSP